MSLIMFGQNTESLTRSLVFSIPRCGMCRVLRMSACMFGGITTWRSFTIVPSVTDSWSRTLQYARKLSGTYLFVCGHPCMIVLLSDLSVESAAVSFLSCFSLGSVKRT